MNYIEDNEKHVKTVEQMINIIIAHLRIRAMYHDKTKFDDQEREILSKIDLSEVIFGSDEYYDNLKKLQEALQHHYKYNYHHPEHYETGIIEMNLVDIVEMFCDWTASIKRNKDGDIYRSIEICQERFGYSDELAQIFRNTAKLFE